MQKSSENPDRLDGSKSFSLKNLNSLLNKSFEDLTGDRRQRDRSVVFDKLFPFYKKFHVTKTWLKQLKVDIWILFISWPWALFFVIFIMFTLHIWTFLRRFLVRNSKFFGSSLLCFGSEHCSAKNVLKS